MNWKRITAIVIGVVLSALGVLWFLQGSDLAHIKPILCFADCEVITGKSVEWQVQGAIAFVIGAVLVAFAIMKSKKKKS